MSLDLLNYELVISENEPLDEALEPYKNSIIIVATGGCKTDILHGYYTTLMKYKDTHKLLKGDVSNAVSANYSILFGVLAAVKCIKRSSNVIVVSCTTLGFQGGLKFKGKNKEIVKTIFDTLLEKKCTFTELRIESQNDSNNLNKYIARFYPDELKKYDKQKHVNTYTTKIKTEMQKQTLAAAAEILKKHDISQQIINEILSVNLLSD